MGNRFSPTTIAAAISTQRRRAYPFHVAITAQQSSLPQDSVVKCEQIQTIDQTHLSHLIGFLDRDKMREVDDALHRSLGLES